jgi:protease-4
MKQFFKFMFASMVGFFLSFLIITFISFLLIVGIVAVVGKDKSVKVADNSILLAKFNNPVTERTSNNPLDNLDLRTLTSKENIGLNDILDNIKKAKTDNHIKGILLDVSSVAMGAATLQEVRNALIDFKTSGKFIYAYSEEYTQGSYYLASAADQVFLNPQGGMDFKGLAVEMMFFKGTLDKLEIEPEIIRHGKFKSAVEPFITDKMSDANRKQIRGFVGTIWNVLLENVSKSRGIEVPALQLIADSLSIQKPEDALKYKLVDKLVYRDELMTELSKKLGTSNKKDISFVNITKYTKAAVKNDAKHWSSEKIAIVYAVGEIRSGKGKEDVMGSETTCEALKKARTDDKIKAVVLRVNSPGGSALASDVIWREVLLTKAVKPVVVSMGDVAASGGYYISCAADTIVAEPNTITGSIGVFGVLWNSKKFWNDKLGVTFDTVLTGKYADIGSSVRPMRGSERAVIQRSVEKVYDTFISRVAEGRHISKADVDSIGQGRVWSGIDAQKIHLVDVIGGIDKAVEIAARMAKVTKYNIISLPEQKDPLNELLSNLTDDSETSFVKHQVGDSYKYYTQLQSILKQNGIQTRMEYDLDIY